MKAAQKVGIALLIAGILLGCVITGDPITVASSPRPQSPEPLRETAIEVTAAPTAAPEIPYVPLTPEPYDLSPYRVTDEGLYDILPLVGEPNKQLIHAGFAADNVLLLLFYDQSDQMLYWQHFDLLTAKRTTLRVEQASRPITYREQYVFYACNPPLYRDVEEDVLVCMSADLQSEWRVPNIGYAECCWDGTNVLRFDTAARTISRLCPDGTETELFSGGWRYRYSYLNGYSADRRYAVLNATDAYLDEFMTVLVDLTDGSIVGKRQGDTYISFSENRYAALTREYRWDDALYIGSTAITLACADTPDEPDTRIVQFERNDFFPSLYVVPGGFVGEVWNEDATLYFWDDSGETEWSAKLPLKRYQPAPTAEPTPTPEETDETGTIDDSSELYPAVREDGADSRYLLCDIRLESETAALLLWDRTAGTRSHTTGITYAEPLFSPVQAVDTTPARYADRLAAIEQQYGITVLIGDAAHLSITSYVTDVASIEQSLHEIDETLNTLETVLAKYPPDFFRRLLGDTSDSLVVELCGAIRSTDAYALNGPSAVTCHTDGARIIALDVSYYYEMEYTLYHEISHLIDRRLDAITQAEAYWSDPDRDFSVWNYSDWESMNPDGFSYYYAYVDEHGDSYEYSGSVKYTPSHSNYYKKNKRSSVYFFDTYSKTYPTEDRAVMLGRLLAGNENDEVLSCPHLLKKLEYYSAAIRALLDPDGTWRDPTAWELRIEELRQRN